MFADRLSRRIPAATFHRWERHAALCTNCEDLPGMVVRSIAALYTYKMDELAVPAGLNERILQSTIGTAPATTFKPSWASQVGDWWRGLSFPIGIPQLAPVAMMMMFAFLMFSQDVAELTVPLSGVYQESVELAKQTYQQGKNAWNGKPNELAPASNPDPITGTTPVANEGPK